MSVGCPQVDMSSDGSYWGKNQKVFKRHGMELKTAVAAYFRQNLWSGVLGKLISLRDFDEYTPQEQNAVFK